MKENKELERDDLAIDREIEVDCGSGREITAYIETWFDVDNKFGIHTKEDEDAWLNLYAKYNPFEDTLLLECEISRSDENVHFAYEPTAAEAQLIKDMIMEKIQEIHGQTPQEFCSDFCSGVQTMGGI